MPRFLEDFAAGQKFGSGSVRVDAERLKSFAAESAPASTSSAGNQRGEPVQVSVGNLVVPRRGDGE